ncbi:DNA-directed RNA polymerase I subunit RPA1-like [Saccoglossus kowalevskii]
MMHSIPSKRLCGIRFKNFSTKEIKNLSVQEITNPQTFDQFHHPSFGGLYDPKLGPADRDDFCGTCSLNYLHCPGHFGHIVLPLPVYNPLFFRLLVKILKGSCLNCHHLLAGRSSVIKIKSQLKCLEYGILSAVDDLENIISEASSENNDIDIIYIQDTTKAYVDKALQGIDKEDSRISSHVRNVTEQKKKLITDFINTEVRHLSKCHLCKKKVCELRAEHNSKIYFKKGSKRKRIQITENKSTTPNEEATEETIARWTGFGLNEVYLTPQDAREHMKLIIQNEGSLLHHLFGALADEQGMASPKSVDVFFLDVVPVPPSRFRPISQVGDKRFENPQTSNLSNVLGESIKLQRIVRIIKIQDCSQDEAENDIDMSVLGQVAGKNNEEKLHNCWISLQTRVNCVVDSDLDRLNSDKHPGIRQILEKKDGLLRKHMMGKRVNYAARSVISPDPNIATDEIGIPSVIATKLTYPQPVTPWNVKQLRNAVINGPDKHPGASIVENEDGSKTLLRADRPTQRDAIAKQLLTPSSASSGLLGCKKVHRHVKNGDLVLLNRQPTLHKPSIMAHKVRVLPGEKTLRLHYANCKSYNADFDGDEMNVHLPQNELGRAEASVLATTNNQYLVPKDCTPLSGLIQDHMVSGVRITIRGRFFNSVFLRGFCGVLSKARYGPTPYGLVHCCHELYGGEVCGRLLTCLGRLFTTFLQTTSGFSLGVEDILVTETADAKRRETLVEGAASGPAVVSKALHVEDSTDTGTLLESYHSAHTSADGEDMKEIDLCMKSKTDEITNNVNKACMPNGLLKRFPENNLQLMVQAGAKGSQVNCMQISCLLGQIELEGRRPPLMISGRSLPSFLPYDTSPRAGGFVDGRFLTGIRPQEYYFHCMAGREGLVDTAVKTSRSGYLQRCLIKHLEGLIVGYDLTVRDSDGSVVQFQYGEDGLDILKTPFLQEKQFPFMISNENAVLDDRELNLLMTKVDSTKVKEVRHKIKKWRKKFGEEEGKKLLKPFVHFCNKKGDKVLAEIKATVQDENTHELETKETLVKMWHELTNKDKYLKSCKPCPDPVISQLRPDVNFGSTSDSFYDMTESYVTRNPHGLLDTTGHMTSERFRTLMNLKYMTSLCHPGEAVGLLAAQSIGEPSTQMTLNTFHFAGRGEMNVTLGIPRLREILMVASSNIQTPSMSIPVLNMRKAKKQAKKLKRKLTRLYFSDVLENVEVAEIYEVTSGVNNRVYKIRMSFLPADCYKEEVNLKPSDVLYFVEKRFIRRLLSVIRQKMRQITDIKLVDAKTRSFLLNDDLEDVEEIPKQVNEDLNESSEDDENDNDDDAVAKKLKKQKTDDMEYDEEEEEEEEAGNENDSGEETEGENLEEMEQEDIQGDNDNETYEQLKSKKRKKKKDTLFRINNVVNIHDWIHGYEFDEEDELWCQVVIKLDILDSKMDMCSVIENEAKKLIVYETPGVKRCFLSDNTDLGHEGKKTLHTEGVSIMEMFTYDKILDLNKLYSNDIHAMAATYGIEAARKVLIKEIQEVFKAYGIHVNARHLTLVADYMTYEGVYRPFNRFSLQSSASPLQQMSFEQSMTFLKQATIDGSCDQLKSPSARLAVGRVVSGGTGSFELVQPLV